MRHDGVPLPIKVLACVPGLIYGAMIFLAEGMPRSWLAILAAALIGAFVLCSILEYPFQIVWPAFVGVFLLVMCALAVARGLPDTSPLPLTGSDLEVWGVVVLACLYIIWGGLSAHRAVRDIM